MRTPSSRFPAPQGPAGSAHFKGAVSAEAQARAEMLRGRAEAALGPSPARPRAPATAPAPHRPTDDWPRPPACLPHVRLDEPPGGARVAVCGLVIVRQRPGSAKGVIFVTLEDETGVANIVVWAKVYERFRRAIIAGRLLRVTGRLQRESGVVHVVAERVEDVSHLLDLLSRPARAMPSPLAPADEVARPQQETRGARPRPRHPRDQAAAHFPR